MFSRSKRFINEGNGLAFIINLSIWFRGRLQKIFIFFSRIQSVRNNCLVRKHNFLP